MFKNTIHVPIVSESTVTDIDIANARQKLDELLADEETLNELREYFIALGLQSEKTMSNYEMPPAVSEHAQAKFIEARKKEQDTNGKVKTDDYAFHRFLVLARYLSVAKKGSLELSSESFDEAKELEVKRVERVEARTAQAAEKKLQAQETKEHDAAAEALFAQ